MSRRRRLRRPFFFATEERENNRAGCGGRFSLLVDIDIIDKSLSPPRSVRRVLYKSPIDDYHDSSFPLFSLSSSTFEELNLSGYPLFMFTSYGQD